MSNTHSIGVEKEGSLHRALKFQYAGEGGEVECKIEGFVCDGVTAGGEVVEVQTGSFGPLKEKIRAITKKQPVRIIHPVIITKYIELYDIKGALIRRRKSNRKGTTWDFFKYLVYAPDLPLCKNLIIELVQVDVVEKRIDDGTGSWRRKGARIQDRELTAFHEKIVLNGIKDYSRFLPFEAADTFTVKDMAQKARIQDAIAGKTLYVLTKLKLVEKAGKKGNAILYQKTKNAKVKPRRQTKI